MNISEIRQNNTNNLNTNNPFKPNIQRGNTNKGLSFSQVMDNIRGTQSAYSVISNTKNGVSLSDPRLPGDFIGSFKIENPTPSDFHAEVQGMARSFGKSGGKVYGKKEIDKTDKLYEQALELESYFVKIMLDSMRKTLNEQTLAGEQSFAGKMYKDMMYEELSRNITKSAGFGLADQIYLELKA